MRVAIYIRVSTLDQAREGYSLAAHLLYVCNSIVRYSRKKIKINFKKLRFRR